MEGTVEAIRQPRELDVGVLESSTWVTWHRRGGNRQLEVGDVACGLDEGDQAEVHRSGATEDHVVVTHDLSGC